VKLVRVALLVTVALSIASCSGDDSDDAAPITATTAAASTSTAVAATTAPTTTTSAAATARAAPTTTAPTTTAPATTAPPTTLAPTPLEALLGTREEQEARQRQVEDQVALCMSALGWQYTPVDPTVAPGEPGTDEFRGRYGYGITTFIGAPPDPTLDEPDPNAAYVATLGAVEQERYLNDLYGPPDEEAAGDATTTGVAGAVPAGCQGQARGFVYSDVPTLDGDAQQRLDAALGAIRADPRVVAATSDWAACVAAASPPNQTAWAFADTEAIQPYLEAKLTATNTDAPAAVAALQDEERALAAADHACQEDLLAPTVRMVRVEIEQRFLDENPDVIAQAGGG
jgi:hypothetical protein